MKNGNSIIVPQVHVTTDYTQFKVLGGNRAIFEPHYVRLTKAFAKKNMLSANPIIVNEKMEVIDGQHRLKVASDNNLPVYYIILEGATLNTVQALNSNVRAWTLNDYIESYATLGFKPYLKLKEFAKEYALPPSVAASLLMKDAGGAQHATGDNKIRLPSRIKNGMFEIEREEEAHNLASAISELRHYKAKNVVDYSFVGAIRRVYLEDPALLKKLIYKLEHSGKEITSVVSIKDYLRQFEDILNWKTQEKNLIRLY